ncbi:MAG: ferrochelatase [Actinobacteria bacterium]|nr:ferrochelatase [Actinomycetota bacterium]
MAQRTGVLLMAFGGPDSLESVGPFMARFMGCDPSPEAVAAARRKYAAIGGASPLPAVAAEVAAALEAHLVRRGHDVVVRAGMRYWEPSISSALRELREQGAARVVTASLSAFESRVTCEAFRSCALEAADGLEINDVREAPALHRARQYRDFFGYACAHALEHMNAERPLVVMTAHSLPVSDLVEDDPYPAGLREVADAVAAIAGLAEGAEFDGDERLPGIAAFGSPGGVAPWLLAYQSKGARPGAWLGPDLAEVTDAAAAADFNGLVVVPIGFAVDHMETLWDLDIEAAGHAGEAGIEFLRTAVPNTDDDFIEALVWAVEPLL